jgi:hypothetical protein
MAQTTATGNVRAYWPTQIWVMPSKVHRSTSSLMAAGSRRLAWGDFTQAIRGHASERKKLYANGRRRAWRKTRSSMGLRKPAISGHSGFHRGLAEISIFPPGLFASGWDKTGLQNQLGLDTSA